MIKLATSSLMQNVDVQLPIIDHNATMMPYRISFHVFFFFGGNHKTLETLETLVLGEDGQVMKGDHGVWMIGTQLFLTAWTEAEMLASDHRWTESSEYMTCALTHMDVHMINYIHLNLS